MGFQKRARTKTRAVALCRYLSNGRRMDLVRTLVGSDATPTDLVAKLGISPSLVSRYVRELIRLGLASQRREGLSRPVSLANRQLEELLTEVARQCGILMKVEGR